MFGIHRAASSTWGDKATSRLCSIIVDSNSAYQQQVTENRTDLLDTLGNEDLLITDDLGIGLIYLCINYDRLDMLKYLHGRGIDLALPCDPMGYGNAMFYAGNS